MLFKLPYTFWIVFSVLWFAYGSMLGLLVGLPFWLLGAALSVFYTLTALASFAYVDRKKEREERQ